MQIQIEVRHIEVLYTSLSAHKYREGLRKRPFLTDINDDVRTLAYNAVINMTPYDIPELS